VLVAAPDRRIDLHAARMDQEQDVIRILHVPVEQVREVVRAALEDAHEGQAPMAMGLAEDVVQRPRQPVDGLGDEGDVGHAEGQRGVAALRVGGVAQADFLHRDLVDPVAVGDETLPREATPQH